MTAFYLSHFLLFIPFHLSQRFFSLLCSLSFSFSFIFIVPFCLFSCFLFYLFFFHTCDGLLLSYLSFSVSLDFFLVFFRSLLQPASLFQLFLPIFRVPPYFFRPRCSAGSVAGRCSLMRGNRGEKSETEML